VWIDVSQAAYECMHSIFETCLKEITIEPFLERVIAGLSDEEEIKKICYILIVKLAQVAPDVVSTRSLLLFFQSLLITTDN